MVKIEIDEDACVGCGSCVEDCPNDVYEMDEAKNKTKVVNEDDCRLVYRVMKYVQQKQWNIKTYT